MSKGSLRGALRRRGLVVIATAVAGYAAVSAAPSYGAATVRPVPSLQPKATAKLWKELVLRPRAVRRTAECRPLRAVFYAASDWMRLATKLAAASSPCAEYYISLPPLAADKTAFRYDQPWRIRALGTNFHVLAEINTAGWSTWVANNGGSWHAAGVEARRRMDASGFDVTRGDSWVVNELSSAVRRGDGDARANIRELLRGLYEGDGSGPAVKGAVFITGMSQATTNLSTYKANLQEWFVDAPFWQDMAAYVGDWSQELYGDVRAYAVEGATLADRRAALEAYLGHELTLANAGPDEIAAARSFLRAAYNPLANSAWQYESAFGWTAVPYAQMQDFVSAQTYALRSFAARSGQTTDRFGFAWALKVPAGMTSAEFATQSGYVADRLAAAIRDSAAAPNSDDPGIGACAPEGVNAWCAATVSGAAFNPAWNTFATWSPPALGFSPGTATATAGVATGPLTVQLRVAGVARPAESPVTVSLASTSAHGAFAPAPDGPWTNTLQVVIAGGASGASFFYRDTIAGTATVTATATGRVSATLAVTVAEGPLANLAVAPAPATVVSGGTQPFTATGSDVYGNPVAITPTWTLESGTPGTLSTSSGVTTTFSASPATGGSGSVTASVGSVTTSVPVAVIAPKLRVSSITYGMTYNKRLLVTVTVGRTSDDQRIPGATVAFTTYRDGGAFASATVQTGGDGRATYTTPSTAWSGCYTTTVRSVSGANLTWDGVTPPNRYCR